MLESIGKEVVDELLASVKCLEEAAAKIDEEQFGTFTKTIMLAHTDIFCTGEGRSGLVAKVFAMRLRHIGLIPHVVGSETAPPVMAGNLFIMISGSGTNGIDLAEKAKNLGAKLLVLTASKNSPLASMADVLLVIPGRKPDPEIISYSQRRLQGSPVMALGTLFEELALLVLDSISGYIAAARGMGENDLKKQHANIQK